MASLNEQIAEKSAAIVGKLQDMYDVSYERGHESAIRQMCERSFTEAVIPEGVTTVSNYAFYGCSDLLYVAIPDTVTYIGNSAFYGCSKLIEPVIPDGVTSIGSYAFFGCQNLKRVLIPDSVTRIGNSAFRNIVIEGVYISNIEAWLNISFGDQGSHPNDYGRLHILNENGDEVTDIIIPDSVTSIPDYIFIQAESITNVTIHDNVTTIGDSAFSICDNLVSVVLGNGVTTIKDSAFLYSDKLSSIFYNGTEEDWLKITIGDYNSSFVNADHYYYNAEEPTENGYFWHWVNGKPTVWEEYIPSNYSVGLSYLSNGDGTCSVAGIGDCNDSDIVIPDISPSGDDVVSIGDDAFRNYSDLTSIVIPDNITHIGSNAFYGCQNLEDVYIKNIESWLNIEFENSYSHPNEFGTLHILGNDGSEITDIIIPDGIETVPEYAFMNAINITSVVIPSSVSVIGEIAFLNCSNLASIVISDGVTVIGENAFDSCTNLTDIVIPNSVTSIDKYAFYSCDNLGSVIFENVNGWWRASKDTATSGTEISATDLSDPESAAGYLVSTYVKYYWKRTM
jgi:hypothetical protein